jgi:hypothetical protein
MATPLTEYPPWILNYDLAEGGLIIQDVQHDGFNLARDIRVTRVWIDTEYPDQSDGKNLKQFKLNSSDLPATAKVDILSDSSHPLLRSPSKFFSGYRNLFGMAVPFKSTTPYLANTPNEAKVDLIQKYLFGNYGKNPAHEAFAVLDATRLFPLLSFSFPAVKDSTKPYPRYFRADYRLDINLDNIDESALRFALGRQAITRGDATTNKAAIFRDQEEAPGLLGELAGAGRFLFKGGNPQSVEHLFAALEKPLKYEIASWGLVGGRAPGNVSNLDTWDNVHIWPARRRERVLLEPGSPISTPGAFHAFHCHWRWGAVSGDPSARDDLVRAAGEPQFRGVGWSKSAGGALVDGAIAKQNLQFAVTRNDIEGWKMERNPSEKEFNSLFKTGRKDPDNVSDGADLVFWLSFEVFRDEANLGEEWGGTLFVNGFYFGHNKDTTPQLLEGAGAYGEAVVPSAKKKWERFAREK